MVHTTELFIILNNKEGNQIEKKYNVKKGEEKKDITQEVTDRYGVKIDLRKVMTQWGVRWEVKVFVDFIKLLGKSEITLGDRDEIMDGINNIAVDMFGSEKSFKLRRIDFRFDVVIENISQRKLYIKLFKKCQDNVAYMKKDKNKAYKTSTRYKNKGKAANIYDKEAERKDKGCDVMWYEKNVLRFEAQVMSNSIKYMQTKYDIEPTLDTYLKTEMHDKFMKELVLKPIGAGDYYSASAVKKKMKGRIKDSNIKQLLELLNYISSKRSMSKAKVEFGSYKFKKFMKILNEEGINPVVIPKSHSIHKLENPLKELINSFEEVAV